MTSFLKVTYQLGGIPHIHPMLPLSKNQSPVYRNFAIKYFFGVALNADSKDYKYSCVSTEYKPSLKGETVSGIVIHFSVNPG
jgi:hypothetical protein